MATPLSAQDHRLGGAAEVAKICFVCISLRAGGTERVVTRLANAFAKYHKISIVIAHDSQPFYELDERVGLFRHTSGSSNIPKWRRALSIMTHLRTTIRSVDPDIILSFGEAISPLTRIATIGCRSKLVIFNRESPLRSLRGRAGVINPLLYPFANAVVTQTGQAKRFLRQRYRFTRFEVIPNPVAIPSRVAAIETRPRTVISVGFLGGAKNQRTLLKAFASSSQVDQWKLLIVGAGPDRSSLIDLSKGLGIRDRVEFLGERKDIAPLLSRSRIFAFSSLSEGFPNALSEALAHGCACIAFDCVTGPSELIQNNRNGLLSALGDEEGYSAALEKLMCDESLQQRYSIAARKDIERFSENRVLKQFDRLITQILSPDQRRGSEPCDS